ncbi:GGL domain protein [Dictyocaulus viviparus]|uniref:Guanine nucleotide-binding protein subunit gamma n=1 Tax=Dictyocaulus viviparus TaxID=29172 RepID=A0A0D8XMQ7_DICVI|nr:GGL domain protein [Dictyocaulus viviparus]
MDVIKQQTDQLRIEAQLQRKKVSETARGLLEYCEKNKSSDMLVSGPSDAQNPFQEKKSCDLL